jgi:hypothetical protein
MLFAGSALGADAEAPDLPFLLKCLQHSAPVVRERAAAELRSRGDPAALALAVVLQHGTLLTSTQAAAVLVEMREDAAAATPLLLNVLRDGQAVEWRGYLALRVLTEIGAEARQAALSLAIAALDGDQPMKQRGALDLIRLLKTDAASAADPLRRLLHRSRAPFRSVIVSEAVIQENLVAFTKESPIYDDLLILEVMHQVGVPDAELAPLLVDRAKSSRTGIKLLAATQLALLDAQSRAAAGRIFAQLLGERSPALRETALEQLATLGPAGVAATDPLCRLLEDRDPKTRERAALALGEIGPAAGAPAQRALAAAIQTERLLADSPGVLSALARQRAERMAAALERIRGPGSE